jgi:hypothetical protein
LDTRPPRIHDHDMTRHARDLAETKPMRERVPRPPLAPRDEAPLAESIGMSHAQLVAALRAVDGVVDVSHDRPNFHFRGRPFLHFHEGDGGTYADVRFGSGDFESVWASTPRERAELLARVCDHVERLERASKSGQRRAAPGRRARHRP